MKPAPPITRILEFCKVMGRSKREDGLHHANAACERLALRAAKRMTARKCAYFVARESQPISPSTKCTYQNEKTRQPRCRKRRCRKVSKDRETGRGGFGKAAELGKDGITRWKHIHKRRCA